MNCKCNLLWCDECNGRERERLAELELPETNHARELARTIDRAFELEAINATEARAIACGALALLAEATGLDPAQTVELALKVLGDVRRSAPLSTRERQSYEQTAREYFGPVAPLRPLDKGNG